MISSLIHPRFSSLSTFGSSTVSRATRIAGILAFSITSTTPFSVLPPSSLHQTRYHQFHQPTPATFGTRSFTGTITPLAMSSVESGATTTDGAGGVIPGRPTWQQTMLRIKDPEKSLDFYCNKLGFTLIDSLDFPQYSFCLYFITHLPPDEPQYTLTSGTQAAHDYLWSMEGTALELTHNYGTEKDDQFSYHAGNQEKDGFGHVAVK